MKIFLALFLLLAVIAVCAHLLRHSEQVFDKPISLIEAVIIPSRPLDDYQTVESLNLLFQDGTKPIAWQTDDDEETETIEKLYFAYETLYYLQGKALGSGEYRVTYHFPIAQFSHLDEHDHSIFTPLAQASLQIVSSNKNYTKTLQFNDWKLSSHGKINHDDQGQQYQKIMAKPFDSFYHQDKKMPLLHINDKTSIHEIFGLVVEHIEPPPIEEEDSLGHYSQEMLFFIH